MLSAMLWGCYSRAAKLPEVWRLLDEHKAMNPVEARLDLARRLQAQIRHFSARADALPEWKEAARIGDPLRLMALWPQLPIVTRKDLQTRFAATEIQQRFGIKGLVSRTGGSTGEPTAYLHDEAMLRSSTAARSYCRLKAGWRPGMATIAVWGSERDVGRASTLRNRISGKLRKEWIVGGYSLTKETVDRVVELIEREKPVAIYGFTSMLEYVAREMLQRGVSVPKGAVVAAWNGGEMLNSRQEELFELAFGIPLLNLYGSRELSAMAYQPQGERQLLPLRPLLFVEIVDELGRPVPAGESGRLLWTSTVCRGTPFLRYECGDLGSFEGAGADESGIRSIAELQGRSAGLIELNGKTINGLFWNHLFKDYPEVEQFQVAVQGGRELELRLKGKPFSETQEQRLRLILRDLAGDTTIRLKWVDQLTRSRQGKLEQVLREG